MRVRLFLTSVLTVAALTLSGGVAAKTILKFSIGAPDSGGGEIIGMKALKEYVEFKSGGEIEIRLFFNTFGGSLQVTEQVKNGTLEMALTDDSVLGSFHKPMQIFQIPYLFPSSPVAWEFMKRPPRRRRGPRAFPPGTGRSWRLWAVHLESIQNMVIYS